MSELSRNLTIKYGANESECQYQENASRRRKFFGNRLKLVLKPSRLPLRGTSGQVKQSFGLQEKHAIASLQRNQMRFP